MFGVMTDESGLYYMRARYYSPLLKRFVNRDVLVGGVGEGQSLNRFAFVTGRPVSWVDPFGLEGYEITQEQERLAKLGKFIEFWKSRWQVCRDPVARTALIGWGTGELVDATWFERLSAQYTWWTLSRYIDSYDLSVSLEQIGAKLARVHAEISAVDFIGVAHLLSPRQVARYHHDVFIRYGIPHSPLVWGNTNRSWRICSRSRRMEFCHV